MNDNQKLFHWFITALRETAWAPISVFLFYLVGLAYHWYDLFPPLDVPTHFTGGVVITYFYRSAIRNSQTLIGEIPFPIQIILAFTATGTTAILWEFSENGLDYFLRTHMVRGLNDTLLDMFLGLSGALTLSLFYRKR